jgi:hypothetical protein
MKLPSSGTEPPRLATARPLGLPLGSPRRCAEDASHRLLQPTSRIEHPEQIAGFPSSAACAAVTSHRERNGPRPASDSATTDAEPPCGNPAPDERALDGACPTSALSSRALRTPWGAALGSPFVAGRRARRGVFDRERDRRKRPLTSPVALRRTRRALARRHLRRTRTASTARASTLAAFPARDAFPRRVLEKPLPRFPSPPPITRLCRRAPASDAASPSPALAREG